MDKNDLYFHVNSEKGKEKKRRENDMKETWEKGASGIGWMGHYTNELLNQTTSLVVVSCDLWDGSFVRKHMALSKWVIIFMNLLEKKTTFVAIMVYLRGFTLDWSSNLHMHQPLLSWESILAHSIKNSGHHVNLR